MEDLLAGAQIPWLRPLPEVLAGREGREGREGLKGVDDAPRSEREKKSRPLPDLGFLS
jgi:hypothetical protein